MSKSSGRATHLTTAILPSGSDKGRPVSTPRLPAAQASNGSHISPSVKSELGKLSPILAAGVRRVAGTK
jgi:hypothetical protein